MKIMVASDIHGSEYYCEKLIRMYEAEKPYRLLLLGDILYHGPRNNLPKGHEPKKVIDMLNEISHNILCVRGNCDTEVDQMVLDFPIMSDYAMMNIDKTTFFATHGHLLGSMRFPAVKAGEIILCGHTHVPKVYENDGVVIANCGSVSLPKENSPHSYMIIEDSIMKWYDINGECFMKYEIEG